MRKILVVVLALFTLSVNAFAAPNRVGKVDAGLNVSGILPDDIGGIVPAFLDNAVYVGGTLAYGVTDWFAIGGEAGYSSIGTSVDASGVSINVGDLNAVPLLADFILRMPAKADQPAVPYAVLGLGAIFWNFDSDIDGIDIDVDTSFATKVGGGLDWFVSDNIALNFEASYVFSDADYKATADGDTLSDSVNTDYWQIGGGVKFVF